MNYGNWLDDIVKTTPIHEMYDDEIVTLPTLPTDPLQWIAKARPFVEGSERLILPFWRDIYNDPHNNKMIVGGRQIFKSTYTTDILGCESTSQQNKQLVYVTYDDVNKSAFSRQKLQVGTFMTNPILSQFPRCGKAGSIS